MDLAQQIALLLGDFNHLAPRIKHLDYDTSACGERIHVRCSYISFRQGQATVDEFADVLSEHVVPFCLPRSEIRKAQEHMAKGDHVQAGRLMTALSLRARKLFIKAKKGSHRSGEAGEIVLYILNEWVLKAPQIVSKMYLKTNNNMPVYGTDGIHASFDSTNKKLVLYWGESKAHASLSGALGSALTSIKGFIDGAFEKRELEIISSFPDFDGLTQETAEAFLKYLDPYCDESEERISTFSCLLVYEFENETEGLSDDGIEQKFIEDVNSTVQTFIDDIKETVKNNGLSLSRFEFFLLPVPSVQGFRDKFQERIGWPKDD